MAYMSCIPLRLAGPVISRQPSRLNLNRVREISWAMLNNSMSGVLRYEMDRLTSGEVASASCSASMGRTGQCDDDHSEGA
jgi:hypothetical protein